MTLQEKLNQIEAKKRYISKIRKISIVIKILLFTISFFTIVGLIAEMIKGNITIEKVEKTLIIFILIIIGIDLVMLFNKLIKEENKYEDVIDNFCYFQAIYKPKN